MLDLSVVPLSTLRFRIETEFFNGECLVDLMGKSFHELKCRRQNAFPIQEWRDFIMKKMIALLVVVCLALILAGCGCLDLPLVPCI